MCFLVEFHDAAGSRFLAHSVPSTLGLRAGADCRWTRHTTRVWMDDCEVAPLRFKCAIQVSRGGWFKKGVYAFGVHMVLRQLDFAFRSASSARIASPALHFSGSGDGPHLQRLHPLSLSSSSTLADLPSRARFKCTQWLCADRTDLSRSAEISFSNSAFSSRIVDHEFFLA